VFFEYIPQIEIGIKEGWLQKNICHLWRKNIPAELVLRLPADLKPAGAFIAYLREKYSTRYTLQKFIQADRVPGDIYLQPKEIAQFRLP